jgi:hypothetical protein
MKTFFKPILLLALLCVSAVVPADADAYYAKQVYARFSCTAGETLTAGNVVSIKDADGYCYKADADDATLRPAVGVVGMGGASGASVEVIVQGIISGWTSLSEGAPGYLSAATAGAVTQSAPAYSQQIGYAISATDYFVNCQNYFDSSSLTALGSLSGAFPLELEGATADDYEARLGSVDPTADVDYLLATGPTGSYYLGTTTLATNLPEVANSVWGVSNGTRYEGATANDFETTDTVTDPTADRTLTKPDATGTYALTSGVGSYDVISTVTTSQTIAVAACGTTYYIGTDALVMTLPATAAGCNLWFVNTGAAGNNIITLSPNASDNIKGSTRIANGTTLYIDGADDEDVVLTKATSVLNDYIHIVGNGTTGWQIRDSNGIFAEASP